jgi:hypothetical protein
MSRFRVSSLNYLNEVYNEASKLAEDERVRILMRPWVFSWDEDVSLEDVKGGIVGYLFASNFQVPQTCPICLGKIPSFTLFSDGGPDRLLDVSEFR